MWVTLFTVSLLFTSLVASGAVPRKVIRLGGIFNEDPDLRLASQKVFEFAVSQVNKRQQEIEFLAVSATAMDVVETAEKSHELVISSNTSSAGVIGLFLVTDQASSDMGASLCERLGIPVIHPLPELSFLHKKNQAKGNQQTMAMHIHPDVRTLSSALLHFVRAYQWGDIVVLYKGTEGLDRIKSVLNAGFLQFGLHEKIEIIFWPMADMQRALKDLRYGHSYQHILVDIKTEDIADFLKAAHKIGMLTSYQHYMFTSLDLGALSLDKTYTSGGVNITGYRLLDEESAKSQEVLKNWIAFNNGSSGREIFEAHHALMVDSVNIYSQTVLDYYAEKQSLTPLQTNLSSDDGFWESGPILLDRLYNVSYEGLTGDIKLVRGKRLDFALELIEYDNLGNVQVVGNWNVADGLDIANSENRRREEIQRDLKNKTLRVVVKLEEPFIMKKHDKNNNTHFYGFAKDMLDRIAQNLNFSVSLFEVADETTGHRLENGSWTGMIGTLIKKEADLALGELTINYERSSVIDFTKPFMNMGISILFKRPKQDPPKLFSFLQPFHDRIWMCMIGAYAFVSVYTFAVARVSPYEWKNPHACNPDSDTLENEFTMLNSFWFAMGSLMLQGSEVAPRASSTRIISGVWSFFTLILISSYTANLAAFLTITRMSTPIQNADDLSKQTAIKYGCQYGGSTYRFFQADGHDSAKAKIPTYEKMWNFMSQNPDVFVNKSQMGIAKVKGGKYAYLMESTPLRYQVSKNCDLMEVGGELDSKGYGIGLPKNSPYRDIISNEILRLSESQVLLRMYNEWWDSDANEKCEQREDSVSSTNAAQLGMDNLGGVFVFLVGGFALALTIAILEFCVNAVVSSKSDRQTLCSGLAEECKFSVNCCGPSKKPVRLMKHKISKKLLKGYGGRSHPRGSDSFT